MDNPQGMTLENREAHAFLAEHFDPAITDVDLIGQGAWSRCFGFRRGHDELVVRFGRHVEDFHKDQRAAVFAAPGLPVPQVLAVGRAFDGYYAVSTRAHGEYLDHLGTDDWQATIPSTVAMLEALRQADVTGADGYGGWDGEGNTGYHSWSSYLLAVGDDPPDRRTHGWRRRLAHSSVGEEVFAWGYQYLQAVADDSTPRHLIHGDLMNRNVLVQEQRITGVFDWGCAAYGDHLYDLAWFEFWAPWYPEKDMTALRNALEEQWHATGYRPRNMAARLQACYLHIGLDHLAYNAWLRDWETLEATAEQMRALVTKTEGR